MTDWATRPQRIVVAAFLHHQGEILLASRAATKAIAPGVFHLPGGHVEFGEHPAEALKRELNEELAVSTEVGDPIWVFHYMWGTDHTVGIVFSVRLLSAREQIRWQTDDLEECMWVPESNLRDYLLVDDHNLQASKAGFNRLRADNL